VANITGNKAVEDAAVAYVLDCERRAGRHPRDVRHEGAAGDVGSPPRLIEVKAFSRSTRGYDLWLEPRQFHAARHHPDFYLYVVEHVGQGDPEQFTLKVISGERLQRLLARVKERHYFELPWPVADYDTTPCEV